jgi:predicted AAA+ superfamily ATPase
MIETLADYKPRDAYMRRIRPFIGSRIIKVLTGQRRCGKSHILYQIMDEIQKGNPQANIVYINRELAEFRDITGDRELYALVSSRLRPRAVNCLFIDEVQEISHFEQAIQSLFAEGRWDIFCTGSNAYLLSGELATYLAGRYVQIRIHPLSYAEFLGFRGLENSPEALRLYLRFGGMPYLASLDLGAEGIAFEYLRNVYESVLLRDVVARAQIRNVRFLENLAAYIADNTGSLFSANNISKYLKNQRVNMPVQTVINYLEALEKSLLVNRVVRQDVLGLKIFEIGEKYYFEDIGLRNLLASRPQPDDAAKLVEQAVYLFLVQQGWQVTVGKTDTGEIDFIARAQGERRYVQAVYRFDSAETRTREFGSLEAIGDHFPKYVVTMDEDLPPVTATGVNCVRLRDFLVMDFAPGV